MSARLPQWVGRPFPKGWHTKGELQKEHNEQAKRIDFGLFGYAWCAVRGSSILTKDGTWAPIHEAYLHTGHVIGLRDLASADNTKHAEGWRNSIVDAQLEKTL